MDDRAKGRDDRHDPRVTAEHPIHLMVALHGFDPADHRFEAKGITINVSQSGALVRVNRPVTEGSRCLMHLPDGERRIGKTLIYGTVLRTLEVDDTFEVAIRFETRLQDISSEDSLDGILDDSLDGL
jgi:hypothetical protein